MTAPTLADAAVVSLAFGFFGLVRRNEPRVWRVGLDIDRRPYKSARWSVSVHVGAWEVMVTRVAKP